MTPQAKVKVYSFRFYDVESKGLKVSHRMATRQAIERMDGAELLESTGQEVDRSNIDDEGRFRRVATGWGALGPD